VTIATLDAGAAEWRSWRSRFPLLDQVTYLDSTSFGATPVETEARVQDYLEIAQRWGGASWYERDGWLEQLDRIRMQLARVIGADVDEVAIAPSVSVALASIASAINYRVRKRIVLSDMEFPTLAHQWLAKRPMGIECTFVASPDRATVAPEQFAEVLDERTALLATSRVFYTSGYIQDVRTLAKLAHDRGAYLLIDDYQGTGQVPLNVHDLGVDFLVTGTLKWLMGGGELACLYVRRELTQLLEPTVAGWFGDANQLDFRVRELTFRRDARRFELGTPALAAVYLATAGLDVVEEIGLNRIQARNRDLVTRLLDLAASAGIACRIPPEPSSRSAIVMLELPDAGLIPDRLRREYGIIVDARAGALRISPHFYNTVEDLERLIAALTSY
jgi:kynureninase